MTPLPKLHPSKGPLGSVYGTSDGKVYCRTPQGTRTVDPSIGPSLVFAQHSHNVTHRAHHKLRTIVGMIAFAIGLGAGVLLCGGF